MQPVMQHTCFFKYSFFLYQSSNYLLFVYRFVKVICACGQEAKLEVLAKPLKNNFFEITYKGP